MRNAERTAQSYHTLSKDIARANSSRASFRRRLTAKRCKLRTSHPFVVFGVLGSAVPSLVATTSTAEGPGGDPSTTETSRASTAHGPVDRAAHPSPAAVANAEDSGSDQATQGHGGTAESARCTFALETPGLLPTNEPTCRTAADNASRTPPTDRRFKVKDGAYPSPRPLLVTEAFWGEGLSRSLVRPRTPPSRIAWRRWPPVGVNTRPPDHAANRRAGAGPLCLLVGAGLIVGEFVATSIRVRAHHSSLSLLGLRRGREPGDVLRSDA